MLRRCAILLSLNVLAGCAAIQEVSNNVPAAAGTVVGAMIFGGTVSANPDPITYIEDDINREGRIIYNTARRNTQQSITYNIKKMLEPTK